VKTRLLAMLETLRANYWLVPALMAAGAIGLSFLTIEIDSRLDTEVIDSLGWVYGGGTEGARALLSTVAGSIITVAGVVFSIIIVVMSLASSQFGPRILRHFVRDRVNQFVLGTFVATFIYCLLVLRTVRGQDEGGFLPHVSVTVALVLALVSLSVLIFFIHHVAVAIQAPNVIANVAHELDGVIDRLFPDGHPQEPNGAPGWFNESDCTVVEADASGYLQAVDTDLLLEQAAAREARIRLLRRPGHFITAGTPIAHVAPASACDAKVMKKVNAALILGPHRTPTQDVEFAIHQLVEIAVRALSPGVNDPFTAMTCLDWLGSALRRLVETEMPEEHRLTREGKTLVTIPATTFTGVCDAAFNQIRQHARRDVAVTIRLLETIAAVASDARRPEHRDALRCHADLARRNSRATIHDQQDQRDIHSRYAAVMRTIETGEHVQTP
jgi:uncharacterized membrane protein